MKRKSINVIVIPHNISTRDVKNPHYENRMHKFTSKFFLSMIFPTITRMSLEVFLSHHATLKGKPTQTGVSIFHVLKTVGKLTNSSNFTKTDMVMLNPKIIPKIANRISVKTFSSAEKESIEKDSKLKHRISVACRRNWNILAETFDEAFLLWRYLREF